MIANKDYLLIKAIKKAKCCCDGKDGGDDQPQVTLKKFAELTIDDINYMMDYPEDLPVCDVMAVYNDDVIVIIDTLKYDAYSVYDTISNIGFFFSTEEKAQEAIENGSYGCGMEGVYNVAKGSTIKGFETSDEKLVYIIQIQTPVD